MSDDPLPIPPMPIPLADPPAPKPGDPIGEEIKRDPAAPVIEPSPADVAAAQERVRKATAELSRKHSGGG